MRRILTVDIGNSNIVIGIWQNECLLATKRFPSGRDLREEELERQLFEKLSDSDMGYDFNTQKFDGAILSSVLPEITDKFLNILNKITKDKPLLMEAYLNTGIKLGNYTGSGIGTDRIVDLAAAYSKQKSSVMVCDIGTYTTITVADSEGTILGGMICSGIQLSLDAGGERASQLPKMRADFCDRLLGTDTESNMLCGAVVSTGVMISGLFEKVRTGKLNPVEEDGGTAKSYLLEEDAKTESAADVDLSTLKLVITGGLARFALPWISCEYTYEPDLLLYGLKEIYEMN